MWSGSNQLLNLMSGGLGSIMLMVQTEEEFWRESRRVARDGWPWPWTWSLAVVLLICTFRLLTFRFRFFRRRPPGSVSVKPETVDALLSPRASGIISDLDLKVLMNELDGNSPDDGAVWENVIDKSNNLISYMAKCCKPKDGPLKYLSTTVFENCSVEALLKFYMDNSYRMQWDKTVVHYQQLEMENGSGTEFGRIIKKFPFLTPRAYVLAWRIWQGIDGSLYCFSKECKHPLAPHEKRYVKVAIFRSGWRIRKVPGRHACEIKMVHQEDAGLNVEMAKVAFAKGIWSYVRKMDDALRRYPSGWQHQSNSNPGAISFIQKVPPEFEVMNDMACADNPENPTAANDRLDSCWSETRKLKRWPSSKLIAKGLVVLGGAICLSRGHSSLGTKVAMAYLLTKLTKQRAFSKKDL